ncbi:unnamed protein product [Rhizopus stolonifer]
MKTPVQVTIQALENQVAQLKRMTGNTGENSQDLQQEITRLKTANEKAEYRIRFLLKTLEEKDKALLL